MWDKMSPPGDTAAGRPEQPAALPDSSSFPSFQKHGKNPAPMAKSELGNRCAVEFKSASLTDLRTLKRLIKSYYALDHIPFRDDEINAGLRALFRDPSLGRAWLIMHGKTTAGYVMLIFWFDLEFGGRAALITDLYLAPAHRRKGLGRRALRFVEGFCRKSGISTLELQVERRNRAAQAFYAANGFRSHARIPMSKRLLPL
jgi:GNAT superfamily N-acetyltransferase